MTAQEYHKWSSSDGSTMAHLSTQTLQELDRLCVRHHGGETGGILIGHYSRDRKTVEVLKAYPPPSDSVFSGWWFVRGTLGLTTILARLWKGNNRQYYVGEWHYHPSSNVNPSGTDHEQMGSIAQSRDYRCKSPILLIIGTNHAGYNRPISITVFPADSEPIPLITSTY